MTSKERLDIVSAGVLSIPEAAAELRVHTRTVMRLMQAGELAYCEIGRRKLIPRKAITAYLAGALRA